MRFLHEDKAIPEIGDTRLRNSFLMFPKRILDETRWLEKAVWLEKFLELTSGEKDVWVPIRWGNG